MKKSSIDRILSCLAAVLLLGGCEDGEQRKLERALAAAGSNRTEMEAVLAHYGNEPEKLRAARFLIANMPGKTTLDTTLTDPLQREYYSALIGYIDTRAVYESKSYEICDSILRLSGGRTGCPGLRYLSDPEILPSDFLIDHIDRAFVAWKSSAWKEKVDFDMFCRHILPYKTGIDGFWSGAVPHYRRKYAPAADSLKNEPVDTLVRYIKNDIKSTFTGDGVFAGRYPFLFPTSYYNIFRARIGTCNEAYGLIVSALRSVGIPATWALIPLWGNSNASHTLLEIPVTRPVRRYDNRQTPYTDDEGEIVGEMFWFKHRFENLEQTAPGIDIRFTRTVPKIYRADYETNSAGESDEASPVFPFAENYSDITSKYVECADVDVKVRERIDGESGPYLCCYVPETTSWSPVAQARLSRNGKATFADMGVNIVYLPAYCMGDRIVPAAPPMLLRNDGTTESFGADTAATTTAGLKSKVPYRAHILYYASDMLGGSFRLANRRDLSDTTTVHTVEKIPYYFQQTPVGRSVPARYVVYHFGDSPYGFLAEMVVWGIDESGKEVRLNGTPIGNPGQYGFEKEKMADGDRVSYFFTDTRYPDLDYVGLDLGKPCRITRIGYLPRNDDNAVVPGVRYELFYWKDGWRSLGIRTGNDDGTVVYDNIPDRALLRLHNTEEGIENRIFILRDGQPVFY